MKKLRDAGITLGRVQYGYEVRKDRRGTKKGIEHRWLVAMLERKLSGWSSIDVARWLAESNAPHKYGTGWTRFVVYKITAPWLK